MPGSSHMPASHLEAQPSRGSAHASPVAPLHSSLQHPPAELSSAPHKYSAALPHSPQLPCPPLLAPKLTAKGRRNRLQLLLLTQVVRQAESRPNLLRRLALNQAGDGAGGCRATRAGHSMSSRLGERPACSCRLALDQAGSGVGGGANKSKQIQGVPKSTRARISSASAAEVRSQRAEESRRTKRSSNARRSCTAVSGCRS